MIPVYKFNQLKVNKKLTIRVKLTKSLISRFSLITGDWHPLHNDEEFAKKNGYKDIIAHGLLVSSLASKEVATKFLGKNMLILSQSFKYHKPVYKNEEIFMYFKIIKKDKRFKTLNIEVHISKFKNKKDTRVRGEFFVLMNL
jgi:3-hydroxybutyryl-CoA dehydratase